MFPLYGMCGWNPQKDRWKQINLFPLWMHTEYRKSSYFWQKFCGHSRPNQSRDRCGRDCFSVEWNIHLLSKLLQTFNSLWKISNNLCTLKKEIKKDCDNRGSGVRTKRLRKETTCLEAQMDPRTSVISLPELLELQALEPVLRSR